MKEIERTEFLQRFTMEYMQRHPNVTFRYAKRQARLRWKTNQKKTTEYLNRVVFKKD